MCVIRPGAKMVSDPTAGTLRIHGDSYARAGMLDFAVNVWPTPRPAHLQAALRAALEGRGYPDERAALEAIARRHERPATQALALAGACEAFWLVAHTFKAAHAVCVHPTFTEAEAALRAAGTPVTRVQRSGREDWALDPEQVPDDADLVVLTNPNNPTGNLDPVASIQRLQRPGRILLIDESFIDFVADEHASLTALGELPGVLVLRSLTKIWGLAGLRAGYLLGPAQLIARLAANRQPWSVAAPALAAIQTCLPDRLTPARIAAEVAAARADLKTRLERIPGVRSWPAHANFILIQVPGTSTLVSDLERERIAVRPCESFPGLGAEHIRLAVRTPGEHTLLASAITRALEH